MGRCAWKSLAGWLGLAAVVVGVASGSAVALDQAADRQVGSPVYADPAAVVQSALDRADEAVARIVAVPDGERTFENTVGALDDALARLDAGSNMAQFMAFVSTDADERAGSFAAQRLWDNWKVELSKNVDLYHAIKAYADTNPSLAGERARLLEHTMRDYKRAGMELPPEQRERLIELEKEMNELQIQFSRNIDEDESVVPLTIEELSGMPQSWLDARDRSGDLYIITMDYPCILPLWEQCDNERTRERTRFVYARRGGRKNVDVLERLIKLRAERARMLGYATTMDFQAETRMAKDAATVRAFYDRLTPIVRRKALADYQELLAAKREHTGRQDVKVNIWDRSFYKNELLKTKYAVDNEKIREYFPLDAVIDGLFSITQSLYGLEYVDVTDTRGGTPERPLWHEDVRLYEVHDKATGKVLGDFYIDLFPRPNKYGHAAQWGLINHKVFMDGTVQKPLAALVCNFTKPTPDTPSLMTHDEVETFFHEFGHCLHTLLSEAELNAFSGTNTELDFVEAPSQMFENWVWDADVLATFSRHYKTGEPLPADLLDRMVAARHLGSGIFYLGQIWLGSLDMEYHTDPDGDVDTTAVMFDLYKKIDIFDPQPHTYFQAGFGHLTNYHAGYYGYLWSLVYASDMFLRFKELGMLNPEAGMYYRQKILSKGGTIDGMDLVRGYLGREPNYKAFLEHLGVEE